MKKILLPFYLLVSVFGLQACNDDDPVVIDAEPPATVTTIVDIAASNGDFSTLVAALQATGLDQTLADPSGTFTVFAPTNAAFDLLGADTIDALLADPDTLASILSYHVLPIEVVAEAAISAAGTRQTTVNGKDIAISVSGATVLINGSTVTVTDIQADNGVIHVIDAVLIPPADPGTPTANIVDTAVAAGDFTTLVAALQATGLDSVLADPEAEFTVFAPTDAAFEMLGEEVIETLLFNTDVLSDILLQHVVVGGVDSITAYSLNGVSAETASGALIPVALNQTTDSLTFGGANVVTTDIYTTNGIIHVIDMVVVADVEVPAPPVSLVERAIEAGNFTTLVAALQATGLDAVLADVSADYTVFAPTDDAFALLGTDTINALLADPDALAEILLYHVVPGTILADAAISAAGTKVTTANGKDFAVSLSDSTLFINGTSVTDTNVLADNGVIHVIDAVLLPPADAVTPTANIVETAVAAGDFTTLVAALQATGLDAALSDPEGDFTVFAPTDAAFAALGEETINILLANTDVLSEILLQHVVAGSVDSITAFTLNGVNATTLSTNEIAIGINAALDTPTFGGANVVIADILTTNGIIHVIDAVVVGDVEVPGGAFAISAPADFSGAFGGAVVADNVYTFPAAAEGFAGFANNNTALYPFTFPEGGLVRFTASIPEGGVDTNVRFVFENAPFPDVDPNFSTAQVLVSGGTEITYEVEIPAQDPAQGFSSFLLYVVERDQPVSITNVVVVKPL